MMRRKVRLVLSPECTEPASATSIGQGDFNSLKELVGMYLMRLNWLMYLLLNLKKVKMDNP